MEAYNIACGEQFVDIGLAVSFGKARGIFGSGHSHFHAERCRYCGGGAACIAEAYYPKVFPASSCHDDRR